MCFQTKLVSFQELPKYESLGHQMFRRRKELFINRLGWKLDCENSHYETDEFDEQLANYFICLFDGKLVGAARIRRSPAPTLLSNYFKSDFEKEFDLNSDFLEVTRFFAPITEEFEGCSASKALAEIIIAYATKIHVEAIVGICGYSMIRTYRKLGLQPSYYIRSQSRPDFFCLYGRLQNRAASH